MAPCLDGKLYWLSVCSSFSNFASGVSLFQTVIGVGINL